MKKRVLSALLALCMACTLAGTVWAAEETVPTPTPASTVEPQTVEPTPTPSAEPTPTPDATEQPEVTAEPSATPDATAEPDVTPEPTEEPEATETPAPSEEPKETPAPTAEAEGEPVDDGVEYKAELEQDGQTLNVIVTAPEGAFDEGVEPVLHAEIVMDEEADKAAETVTEQTGTTFDGMFVLDVYFTDGEDSTEEIEPAVPVSVRLELPEAVLSEGIDTSTLAVHHLVEEKDEVGETVTDENGNAVVNVETVATATTEDEVEGVVALSTGTAEEATVVAAFEAENFSNFVITYNRLAAQTENMIEPYTAANPDGTLTYNGYQLFHGEDTASQGITINVFDYETVIRESNDRESSPINFDGSSRRPFLFLYDPGSENGSMGDYPRNAYTYGVREDIVGDELTDGYPQLAGNGNGLTSSNRSLAYLFDPDQEVSGKTTYANANYLFQKDEQGYYYFDSETNFATLIPKADNEVGNNFWLYPNASNVWVYNYSNGDQTRNQVPQFMPFNTIARGGEQYDQENGHTGNYHFGMTVEFDFLLPENGELEDGSDMTFEFTGDDDVWVYIDGHRVLDLGGIHPSQSGTINFATGEVKVNNRINGYVWNLVGMTEEEWNATEYQTHNLKFFYLERGAGGSNCKLKFNMPTIPSNSVAVTKRVTGDAPDNASYTMQFAAQDTNFDYSQITWNVSSGEPQSLGENNTFTVNAGQTVYVNGIPDNTQYQHCLIALR